MSKRTRLLGTAGAAAALATAALTAAPQSASADEVRPLGGCTLGIICGTVYNNTTQSVKVCLNWNASGTDQAYQPADHCAKVAYAQPHSVYGTPQLVDIDAFYIPSGTTYYGAYSGIPKSWTHTGSGWWKFASSVDVHIDWTA
jgi:hypothetical protein